MRFTSLTAIVALLLAAFIAGRLTVAAPAAAAMPMATTFSHFECYQSQVKGTFSAAVELTDQFQQYETKVGAPSLFCTPVTKKVVSGPHLRVPQPADHLTCYMIQGPTIQQTRPFANQFQRGSVTVGTPQLLCVPTHKTG
jgi:hypothetical protein